MLTFEQEQRFLLREFADISEGWPRSEFRRFWQREYQSNSRMWQLVGKPFYADQVITLAVSR